MKYREFYVSSEKASNDNKYFCKVFIDEEMTMDIDCFDITSNQLSQNANIDFWQKNYVNEQYSELIRLKEIATKLFMKEGN